jgi:hypothetical protein
LSLARIVTKKKHNKDKKLRNLLHSDATDAEVELSWQETVDLVPEDEAERGPEISYFTDEEGNIHSREFLSDELIPDDQSLKDLLKQKPRHDSRGFCWYYFKRLSLGAKTTLTPQSIIIHWTRPTIDYF